MSANAQLVLFAIQAGVKLYNAGQKVYVKATLDRELVLPLPRVSIAMPRSAFKFFTEDSKGKEIAGKRESQGIRDLIARYRNRSQTPMTPADEKAFIGIFLGCLKMIDPDFLSVEEGGQTPDGDELIAIVTVRQWAKAERAAGAKALQIFAGTLVNIAVDYYAYTPEAVSEHRPEGRAIKAFLEALDKIDFSQAPPEKIAGNLMIAIADSAAAHPDFIGNGETERAFVKNISETLSKAFKAQMQSIPAGEIVDASAWLQIVARAFVRGGAGTVLADPEAVLGVDATEGAFVREIGKAVADLVIGPKKLEFRRLFSGEGINVVVKASLSAVAKNPGILEINSKGVENIITGVADELAKHDNLLTKDIFPDLVRLVLDRTADNLEIVWKVDQDGNPEKHLLLTGLSQMLKGLSASTDGNKWPRLNKEQVLDIAEAILDEVIDNPEWLIEKAGLGNQPPLEAAFKAVLESLDNDKGAQLSADTLEAAIKAGITAAAMRLDVLEKLPDGGADAGKTAISATIDAVFAGLFDDADESQKWLRARNSTIKAALESALHQLSQKGASQDQIDSLRSNIGALIDKRLTTEELEKELEKIWMSV